MYLVDWFLLQFWIRRSAKFFSKNQVWCLSFPVSGANHVAMCLHGVETMMHIQNSFLTIWNSSLVLCRWWHPTSSGRASFSCCFLAVTHRDAPCWFEWKPDSWLLQWWWNRKLSRLFVWPLSISMWVLSKALIPVSLSSVVKIPEALLKSAVTERDGSKSVLGHLFKRLESPWWWTCPGVTHKVPKKDFLFHHDTLSSTKRLLAWSEKFGTRARLELVAHLNIVERIESCHCDCSLSCHILPMQSSLHCKVTPDESDHQKSWLWVPKRSKPTCTKMQPVAFLANNPLPGTIINGVQLCKPWHVFCETVAHLKHSFEIVWNILSASSQHSCSFPFFTVDVARQSFLLTFFSLAVWMTSSHMSSQPHHTHKNWGSFLFVHRCGNWKIELSILKNACSNSQQSFTKITWSSTHQTEWHVINAWHGVQLCTISLNWPSNCQTTDVALQQDWQQQLMAESQKSEKHQHHHNHDDKKKTCLWSLSFLDGKTQLSKLIVTRKMPNAHMHVHAHTCVCTRSCPCGMCETQMHKD